MLLGLPRSPLTLSNFVPEYQYHVDATSTSSSRECRSYRRQRTDGIYPSASATSRSSAPWPRLIASGDFSQPVSATQSRGSRFAWSALLKCTSPVEFAWSQARWCPVWSFSQRRGFLSRNDVDPTYHHHRSRKFDGTFHMLSSARWHSSGVQLQRCACHKTIQPNRQLLS